MGIAPARAWTKPPMEKMLLRPMLRTHQPAMAPTSVKTSKHRPAEKKTSVTCHDVGKYSRSSMRFMNEAQCSVGYIGIRTHRLYTPNVG